MWKSNDSRSGSYEWITLCLFRMTTNPKVLLWGNVKMLSGGFLCGENLLDSTLPVKCLISPLQDIASLRKHGYRFGFTPRLPSPMTPSHYTYTQVRADVNIHVCTELEGLFKLQWNASQCNNLYTWVSCLSTPMHTCTPLHWRNHYSVSALISKVICKTDQEEHSLLLRLPPPAPDPLACGGPVVLHWLSGINGDNGSHMLAVGLRQTGMKHL